MNHVFLTLIVSLSLVSVAEAKTKVKTNMEQKIVGGVEAREGELPFMVSLHSGSHFCGGSLIKPNWVLTAAHCARGGSIRKVLVGLHSQSNQAAAEAFTAKQVLVHPQYNSGTLDYDFALIELSGRASFQPIAVNNEEIDIQNDNDFTSTTSGWGYLREGGGQIAEKLQKVDVPLVTYKTCDNSYKGEITDRMICAGLKDGGKDSCQGDSGGPLFVKDNSGNNVLVGVVSWGEGCARENKYGVYSKVNAVADWIDQTTK